MDKKLFQIISDARFNEVLRMRCIFKVKFSSYENDEIVSKELHEIQQS